MGTTALTDEVLLAGGDPAAFELLVAAHGATTATAVDNALWHRGGEPRYKARPRHRARCTQY